MTMVEIRPYVASDAPELSRVHCASFPAEALAAVDLHWRLEHVLQAGGWVWAILESARPVGYGVVTLLPGLDGITELNGCIDPLLRGRGLGSLLLTHILADLPRPAVRQVSYPTEQMDSPAARFLQARGFGVEHVEWQMGRPLTTDQPEPPPWPAGYEIRQFGQRPAVRQFRRLYEQVFAGLPWYQPYASNGEVAGELARPADLLFLHHLKQPIGLAWLRRLRTGTAEIEPFGLVPAFQGQGLGRRFLAWILYRLAGQGISQVLIGAWQNNDRALQLYQRAGFQQLSTRTYLAIDLPAFETGPQNVKT
jgi:GNAT superfamily N-acetyltransferase